jgi:hypothetical protein
MRRSLLNSPYLLYEWLKRKTATNYALWPLELVVWDQATLDRFNTLDNKWNRAIDFWFSQVKEGYIIEFLWSTLILSVRLK